MVLNTLRFRPARSLRATCRGFTLVELLAVTAIIVVVTSVILVNNGRFGGKVQLENLTYDVALTIRQAQVYGISVQRYGAGDFSSGYGMRFDANLTQNYRLYGDINGDGFFDSDEDVPPSPYAIRSGFKIKGLCVPAGADEDNCSAVTLVDIVFRRPEPDAFIRKNGAAALEESARIILESPRGDTMSVVVERNGQISVRRAGQ